MAPQSTLQHFPWIQQIAWRIVCFWWRSQHGSVLYFLTRHPSLSALLPNIFCIFFFFFSFQQGWFGIHDVERLASWTCGGMIFRWRLPLERIMRKWEPLAVEKEKESFLCWGHLVSERMWRWLVRRWYEMPFERGLGQIWAFTPVWCSHHMQIRK